VARPRPRLLPRLLGLALRARVRGSSRATFLLARRLASLHTVPINVNGHQTLYVDLREGLSHTLLAGSPWPSVPWERNEQLIMRRLVTPGDTVLDIGAHLGLHLVLLSELAGAHGRVHAFEANPCKHPTLAATVRLLGNATLHRFGLSDRTARATLFVPEDQSMASLSDWTGGRVGAVSRTECTVKRLDDLVEAGEVDRPAFIKCDVEGGEYAVFAGARATLDRPDAPAILYEANSRSARAFGHDVSTATELLRALRGPRYAFYHVQDGPRLVPLSAFDPGCDHFNLVAVPASRRARLA
jgi:FkbM family methyltransferase